MENDKAFIWEVVKIVNEFKSLPQRLQEKDIILESYKEDICRVVNCKQLGKPSSITVTDPLDTDTVLQFITENPGTTARKVAESYNRSYNAALYHLDKLVNCSSVYKSKSKGKVSYYPKGY